MKVHVYSKKGCKSCKYLEKYLKEILRALNIKNQDELKKTVDNLIDSKEFISQLKLNIKNK